MDITLKLRERFKRDCKIPINVLDEPYFSERLMLYDPYYKSFEQWQEFVKDLLKYNNADDYFEMYNKFKDDMIAAIKESEAYNHFIEDKNIDSYEMINKNVAQADVYQSVNIGKRFISIDMKQANYNALRMYDEGIVGGSKDWKEFAYFFTDSSYLANSKYVRGVVFGNCNSKRIDKLEIQCMDKVLTAILALPNISREDIVSFCKDEIIICTDRFSDAELELLWDSLMYSIKFFPFPLRIEKFQLWAVLYCEKNKIVGYAKVNNPSVEFKGVNSMFLPFIIRRFNREKVEENDLVFTNSDGLLSKLMDCPNIKVIDCCPENFN